MKEFTVSPETLKRAKLNRLAFLEQQLAETHVTISILENSIASYNDSNDITMLDIEKVKWDKLVQNFETVEGVVIPDGSTEPSGGPA